MRLAHEWCEPGRVCRRLYSPGMTSSMARRKRGEEKTEGVFVGERMARREEGFSGEGVGVYVLSLCLCVMMTMMWKMNYTFLRRHLE